MMPVAVGGGDHHELAKLLRSARQRAEDPQPVAPLDDRLLGAIAPIPATGDLFADRSTVNHLLFQRRQAFAGAPSRLCWRALRGKLCIQPVSGVQGPLPARVTRGSDSDVTPGLAGRLRKSLPTSYKRGPAGLSAPSSQPRPRGACEALTFHIIATFFGLEQWQFSRAREAALISAPDRPRDRWSAAVADAALARVGEIVLAAGAIPDLGAEAGE